MAVDHRTESAASAATKDHDLLFSELAAASADLAGPIAGQSGLETLFSAGAGNLILLSDPGAQQVVLEDTVSLRASSEEGDEILMRLRLVEASR